MTKIMISQKTAILLVLTCLLFFLLSNCETSNMTDPDALPMNKAIQRLQLITLGFYDYHYAF